MINKLKTICLSKTNIFAAALSVFAFLKDMQELITSFASHIKLVLISALLLLGMLVINLIISNKKQRNITDGLNTIDIQNKNKNVLIESVNLLDPKKSLFLPKIIFSVFLFIVLMTIGSLYYIKNMGVYYVVVQKGLSINEAVELKKQINTSESFIKVDLSTKILNTKDGMTELVLNNGYITRDNAQEDLSKIKAMNERFQPYIVGPQNVANYLKKLKYIQNKFLN